MTRFPDINSADHALITRSLHVHRQCPVDVCSTFLRVLVPCYSCDGVVRVGSMCLNTPLL